MLRCCSSLVELMTPNRMTSPLQRSVYKTIKWKYFFGQIFFTFYHYTMESVCFDQQKYDFWGKHIFPYYVTRGFSFQFNGLFWKMLNPKISLASNIFYLSSLSSPRSPPTPAAALSPGELSRPANFLRRDLDWELQLLKMCCMLVVVGMMIMII